MPIYRPDGSLFAPAAMTTQRSINDYAPLTPLEFQQVCAQLNQGLAGGITDDVPVKVPTGIFARILQTALVAAGAPWKEPAPIDKDMIAALMEGSEPQEAETDQVNSDLAAPPGSEAYLTSPPDLSDLWKRDPARNEPLKME